MRRLRAVHLNDSLNPCGAHKDRHARIGEGTLGQETFRRIINHPALRNLPFVLETPNELDGGDAREIALLRGTAGGGRMMLQYSALAIFLCSARRGLRDHSDAPRDRAYPAGLFLLLYKFEQYMDSFVSDPTPVLPAGSREGALWRVLTDVRVSTGMTLSIWVTHLMYHFVLVPDAKKRGKRFSDFGASFGNLCAHYITPALVLAQWLFLQDKTGINLWSAVCWLVLPLLYSVFALLRARTGKPIGHTKLIYPYPFLDLEHLGVRRFCLVFLAVLAFFFILGCVLSSSGRRCLPDKAARALLRQ